MPVRIPARRLAQQPHVAADPPLVWHARPGAYGQSAALVADTSRATNSGTTTAAVSVTCPASTLVVAFVTWDKSANVAGAASMSGGGLTWTVGVQAITNSATTGGGAEIHWAYAAAALSAQTVTATSSGATATSLTVVTFAGAAPVQHGAGAKQDNSAAGLLNQSVINQMPGSWTWAVTYNWDTGTAGTAGAGNTIQRTYTDGAGDAGWVQSTTTPTAGVGQSVTVSTSAPSVHGHSAVLEILPDFNQWLPDVVSGLTGTT